MDYLRFARYFVRIPTTLVLSTELLLLPNLHYSSKSLTVPWKCSYRWQNKNGKSYIQEKKPKCNLKLCWTIEILYHCVCFCIKVCESKKSIANLKKLCLSFFFLDSTKSFGTLPVPSSNILPTRPQTETNPKFWCPVPIEQNLFDIARNTSQQILVDEAVTFDFSLVVMNYHVLQS